MHRWHLFDREDATGRLLPTWWGQVVVGRWDRRSTCTNTAQEHTDRSAEGRFVVEEWHRCACISAKGCDGPVQRRQLHESEDTAWCVLTTRWREGLVWRQIRQHCQHTDQHESPDDGSSTSADAGASQRSTDPAEQCGENAHDVTRQRAGCDCEMQGRNVLVRQAASRRVLAARRCG